MQFSPQDLFENLQDLSASKVLSAAADSPNPGTNQLREVYTPFMQGHDTINIDATPANTLQQLKI